jgi:hypothetical protein
VRRSTTERSKAHRRRPRRPLAIVAMTAVSCGCAVAAADGQVSVPGVKAPLHPPPLHSLSQLPSTPRLPAAPQPSPPTTPQAALPKAPAVPLPSAGGGAPKVPSVAQPSLGDARRPGVGGGAGGNDSAGAGSPANPSGPAAVATATARAASKRRPGRAITRREREARRERRLRESAQQLEGCLPALSSFDRRVMVLRGGLHGRLPLSRAGTAQRLNVDTGRIRSAERSGLAGMRKANAQNGCGLHSAAGRNAAARRLAQGTVPALSPLAVAGHSPALVDSPAKSRSRVLGAQASVSSHAQLDRTPLGAGLGSSPADEGSPNPAWAAMLAALALSAGAGLLVLLRRRRAAALYDRYMDRASAYPSRWDVAPAAPPPPPPVEPSRAPPPWARSEQKDEEGEQKDEEREHSFSRPAASPQRGETSHPIEEPGPDAQPTPRRSRRRGRVGSLLGPFAVSSLMVTLVLERLMGRQRRR